MKQKESATHHHTDLNIFAAIVSILEGGHIYTASGQKMGTRIIKLCKKEQSRQFTAYERAQLKG